jgi:hypothetical protein
MAEAKKKSFVRFMSPRGVAVYPKLNKADEYKGKVTFNTKLRLDLGKPGVEDFVKKVTEQHVAALAAAKAELTEKAAAESDPKKKRKIADALGALEAGPNPVRAVTLEDGTDSPNLVELTFKMPATKKDRTTGAELPQRPDLYDATGKTKIDPLKVAVWGGSELKVAGFFMPYYNPATNSAGVSMRMTAVQILKLVTSGNGDPGFEAEEGYTADDAGADPFNDESGGAAESPQGEAKSGVQF